MFMPKKVLVSILSGIGVFASSANASVILSTYPIKKEGSSFTFSSSKFEAIGFRMGHTGAYDVDSVTLRLASATPGKVAVGIFDTTLRTRQCGWSFESGYEYCSYNAPGQLVGSLSTNIVGQKNDYTFGFSDVDLQGNSIYWVVIEAVSAGSFQYFENAFDPSWYNSITSGSDWASSYKSEIGAKIYDFAWSPCSNSAWCPSSSLGSDWEYHSGLDMVAINGDLVSIPSPGPIPLLAIGMAGIIAARQRRSLKTHTGPAPASPACR